MEEQVVIYGVKSNEDFRYIGKTIKSIRGNRELRKTDVGAQYVNQKLKDALHENPDVNMVVLKTIDAQEWYDEKLKEVVDKHKDKHPLINAQWMLDGKRGFWEGKERDAHTLQRLSESKYKRIVEYDLNGNRIKIWESGKEVAINVFKDYKVKNGCGCTRLYYVVSSPVLKGRLRFGSYWFGEAELIQNFGIIPKKINLDYIREKELERKKTYKKPDMTHKYTVIHCDNHGNQIKEYLNIDEAGYALKLSESIVRRICTGRIIPKNFKLKYGKKRLQPVNAKMPEYKTKPIAKIIAVKPDYRITTDDIYDVDL